MREQKNSDNLRFKEAGLTLDLKAVEDDGTFEGYAATFNNVDLGKDMIVPGAFRRTLQERQIHQIKMLRDHDKEKIVGQWVEMKEDERGLKVVGKLLIEAVSLAKETHALMKAKALDALSIGYRTVKSQYDEATRIRKLVDVDLFEVSILPFGMNPLATIDDVKADNVTERDVERILRDAGLANQFAKLVTMKGYAGAMDTLNSQRDAGTGKELAAVLRSAAAEMKGRTNEEFLST